MQYRVLTPINHNGILLSPGELFCFDEKAAPALLESGAIEEAAKPFSDTEKLEA